MALAHPVAAEALDIDRQQRVPEHRPPGKQHRRLEHHPDVPPGPANRRAVQPSLAFRLRQLARENAQRGRLAAAGRADNDDQLAFADTELDVEEGNGRRASVPKRLVSRLTAIISRPAAAR
jgi:hypothetical protein